MLSRKTLIVLFMLLSFFVCFIPFRFSQTAYAATSVNLTYSDVTETSVNLNWSKSVDLLFQHYQIYMKTSSTGWTLVWTINDVNTLTHTVTNLSPGTTYQFKVTNYDLVSSADSNIITVTTPAPPTPSIPWWVPPLVIVAIFIAIILVLRFFAG